MLLAGDIGGTKTDLAIFSPTAGPRSPLAQAEFHSADYASLTAMVQAFLATVNVPVTQACFAVAGPVLAGQAKVTNLPWIMNAEMLQQELNLGQVWLLNDLEATAWAIPILQPEDLNTLHSGKAAPDGTIAVIAPGTGLGEGYLVWNGASYHPYPSEGGHADFAPTSAEQIALLTYLQQRFDHVSVERV
jgi:glucokinase